MHSRARMSTSPAPAPNFEIEMHQHGLLRPLGASELSDGTLPVTFCWSPRCCRHGRLR
jgi:predicted ATPase